MTKNYLDVAIEIAQEAGKILVEELSRPLNIVYKGNEVDLVTQADKRSERFIVERLTKYFPDHAIAAEEGTGHESASASDFRWHVDPLDGTTNFAHGYLLLRFDRSRPAGYASRRGGFQSPSQ